MNNINELLNKIKIRPNSLDLYALALTHPSYNADVNTKHHDYERLEYMGDAVLGFVSADLIFKTYPDMDQGLMSKLRSNLVKSASLAEYARRISLADYIKTGHSINPDKINESNKILEDVFEALIGAIYLDKGLNVTFKFISYFLKVSMSYNKYLLTQDDDKNMSISDDISAVLDSFTFTNHKPQEEYAYVPGTYTHEFKEEIEGKEMDFKDTIILNADHSGKVEFQDSIDVIWSSYEIIQPDNNQRNEYTVEGDYLYYNNDGEFIEFHKEK